MEQEAVNFKVASASLASSASGVPEWAALSHKHGSWGCDAPSATIEWCRIELLRVFGKASVR